MNLKEQFLQLVKEKESTAKHLKHLDIQLTDIMKQLPLGEMFQDSVDGTVYQIIIPSGKFVDYKTIDYVRTKKEGEKFGTLSIKMATEVGFILKEESKK